MSAADVTWRHTERVWDDGFIDGCPPHDPTPDPASPCGQKDSPKGLPCGATASDGWHDRRTWENEPELWHAYQPTLCTCGHPITEVTA